MPAVNIYVIQVFWPIGEIKIGLTPTEFSAVKIVFPDITVKRFLQKSIFIYNSTRPWIEKQPISCYNLGHNKRDHKINVSSLFCSLKKDWVVHICN